MTGKRCSLGITAATSILDDMVKSSKQQVKAGSMQLNAIGLDLAKLLVVRADEHNYAVTDVALHVIEDPFSIVTQPACRNLLISEPGLAFAHHQSTGTGSNAIVLLERVGEQIGVAQTGIAIGLERSLERDRLGHGSQWVVGVALNRMKYGTDLSTCQVRVRD